MSVVVSVEFTLPVGHALLGYQGRCKHLHGHNYSVIVSLRGDPDELGLVKDFGKLKQACKTALDSFDHAFVLNVRDPRADILVRHFPDSRLILLNVNPSAEN